MKRQITTAVVCAVVGIGVGAGAAQARTVRVLPIEPGAVSGAVQLVWGGGGPPIYVPRAVPRVDATQTGELVELRWGFGGAPYYVTVKTN